MAKPKQKYYVVWQGRKPGVYTDWASCEEQVKSFEGARYKAFSSRTEAEEALNRPAEAYIRQTEKQRKKATEIISTENSQLPTEGDHMGIAPTAQQLSTTNGEILKQVQDDERGQNDKEIPTVNYQLSTIRVPSLCVDAACSGNPGRMEYRGVYLLDIHQNGEKETQELFHRGVFDDATNNIGEFLALVHALSLLQQQGNATLPVYSDSRTAQAWVRNRKAKTNLRPTPRNAVLFNLIRRAEQWLLTHTWQNPILKWDTPRWGEIPADFGRK